MNEMDYNPYPQYRPHEMGAEAYRPSEQGMAQVPPINMADMHANYNSDGGYCAPCEARKKNLYSAGKVLGISTGAILIGVAVVAVLIIMGKKKE